MERVLERKLSSVAPQEVTSAGGVKSVVEILNRVDRGTENNSRSIGSSRSRIGGRDKETNVRLEDLVTLDDRSVQKNTS